MINVIYIKQAYVIWRLLFNPKQKRKKKKLEIVKDVDVEAASPSTVLIPTQQVKTLWTFIDSSMYTFV